MSISLLLEMATAGHGDRPALGARPGASTYTDLDARAARVAAALQTTSPGAIAFVGVNGPAVPVLLFAAARLGVPFVPLNYRLPAGQVVSLLADLEAPVLVADSTYCSALEAAGAHPRPTDELVATTDARVAVAAEIGDDAPAVILFTSGTTARPKGVVLRHSNLVSYVLETVEFGSADATEAALVTVPPYHIAAIGSTLTNIYAGRRMVYLPQFEPGAWLNLVRNEGVTSAMVVPTMLSRVVQHLDGKPAEISSLRNLSYGGARMPRPVLEKALELFPDAGFVNAYGLTETSSTIALLGPDEHREALESEDARIRGRLGSVGRLIPGVEGQVRGDDGPVAPGTGGELWVRGAQVSGDYLALGTSLDADGWFPTRDRAWFDDDGYLYIDGRADDTIIRGGENIAPNEIEDVMMTNPAVTDVAVVGLPDDEWGQRLVAVVVQAPDADLDEATIRTWVRDRLRGSRTPDDVVFWPELPYTPTGKLLRRQVVADLTAGPAADIATSEKEDTSA